MGIGAWTSASYGAKIFTVLAIPLKNPMQVEVSCTGKSSLLPIIAKLQVPDIPNLVPRIIVKIIILSDVGIKMYAKAPTTEMK